MPAQATNDNGPSPDRVPLTIRQRSILRFIVRFWGQRGCSPSIREIGAEFGIASPNGVIVNLRFLARKGWIVWKTGDRKSRSIEVPELMAAAKAAAQQFLAALDAS